MSDSKSVKIEEVPETTKASGSQPDEKKDQEGGGYFNQVQLQSVVKVIEGVKLAQTKGAYNIDEAEILIQAIRILTTKKPE